MRIPTYISGASTHAAARGTLALHARLITTFFLALCWLYTILPIFQSATRHGGCGWMVYGQQNKQTRRPHRDGPSVNLPGTFSVELENQCTFDNKEEIKSILTYWECLHCWNTNTQNHEIDTTMPQCKICQVLTQKYCAKEPRWVKCI